MKYISLLTSNHIDIFESLINTIVQNKDVLLKSLPLKYQNNNSMCLNRNVNCYFESKCSNYNNCSVYDTIGNLNLVSFLMWKYYQYTLNNTFLEEFLYPILVESTNYYLHFTNRNNKKVMVDDDDEDDYIYHIIIEDTKEKDLNRDISLLKWSCNTILEINTIINKNDEITTKCENIQHNLSNYTIDSDGKYKYNSIDDLFMFYPLNMVKYEEESKEDQKIIYKTINYFLNTENNDIPSSIIISSLLSQYLPEKRNDSMNILLRLLNTQKVGLSTMTLDSNNEPDISSSLGFVKTLENMILYTDKENIVHIFPIRVNETKSITFKNFRVENGFILSAEMRDFETQWINIQSSINNIITIEVDDLNDIDYTPRNIIVNKIEENKFRISLKMNESITLFPKATTPEIAIHCISDNKRQFNYWGTKDKPFPIPDFPEINTESEESEFDSSMYSVLIIFVSSGITLLYISISMRRNSRIRKQYKSIPGEMS